MQRLTCMIEDSAEGPAMHSVACTYFSASCRTSASILSLFSLWLTGWTWLPTGTGILAFGLSGPAQDAHCKAHIMHDMARPCM